MRVAPRSFVPVLLSLPGLAFAARQESSLLERARAALGHPADPAAVFEGRGKAHASGVEGVLRVVLSGGGSFRLEIDSELPSGNGHDGTGVWTRDRMGLVRPAGPAESARARLFAWVLSGHWLAAREVTVRESTSPPGLCLALADSLLEMTLTLDPATALPRTLVHESSSGTNTWTFEEFVEVGGRRVPRRWTFDEDAGLETFEVAAYRPMSVPGPVFERPRAGPADVGFDPGMGAELQVERLASGHLVVEVAVEGEDAGYFIFDTGAGSMVIDDTVAEELGLLALGEVTAVGVGGKTLACFRRGSEFRLGPLTMSDPVFLELDLGFLGAALGRKISGIVGYDLLARCVAEVETATPFVALHDPARFTLSAGNAWQELVVHGNTPCARARFEGEREGLFRLDTGANGTLSFHAPAVRTLGLLAGREVRATHSGGVGGASAASEGELAWFELAGHRFDRPQVVFSLAEIGAFTDIHTTGNIGQDFLAPFRLVLDYPHERLAFVWRGK